MHGFTSPISEINEDFVVIEIVRITTALRLELVDTVYTLSAVIEIRQQIIHSKKTVKTKTKNPFKKGSWKSWLWKNLRKYNPGRWIRNFHNINCQNFIIWRETEDSDYQVMASNVKLPKSFDILLY